MMRSVLIRTGFLRTVDNLNGTTTLIFSPTAHHLGTAASTSSTLDSHVTQLLTCLLAPNGVLSEVSFRNGVDLKNRADYVELSCQNVAQCG
jgi:hypothetical protein